MKKLIILIFILIVHSTLKIEDCQCQWIIQNSGSTYALNSIHFTDAQTGWAVGTYTYNTNAIILKTTSGGSNWFTLNNQFGECHKSVFFINSQTGWITSDVLYGKCIVIKTTDGGINWNPQYSDSSILYSIQFVNSQTGWIVGFHRNNSLILKTTNEGNNWISQTNPGTQLLESVDFINDQTGWAAGQVGIILKTTNGGLNWIYSLNEPISIFSIYFLDSQTGWIAGASETIYKTTNGGLNWTNQHYGFTEINKIKFLDAQKGWAVGSRDYFTTNGGMNWINVNIISNTGLNDIFFINPQTGWTVGTHGTILKTTNCGNVFVRNISKEIPERYCLYQNYPNPFNPVTKIKFNIAANIVGQTFLSVYDITGREIQTLVNEKLNPGTYEVIFDGNGFPSGVYFYQLRSGEFVETKKLILLK
jgi:photosystem II stability/assembly factor-like uncharacterized protein